MMENKINIYDSCPFCGGRIRIKAWFECCVEENWDGSAKIITHPENMRFQLSVGHAKIVNAWCKECGRQVLDGKRSEKSKAVIDDGEIV